MNPVIARPSVHRLCFLGVLYSDGTAHVSKELEVGAFISKSDSVPQQSMEHFAGDLLREWGWNWMIACCVTGQVTGGCISELEGRQSYPPSPCVLLPVPRYWIPSCDQKQFEALQQHHCIFMPFHFQGIHKIWSHECREHRCKWGTHSICIAANAFWFMCASSQQRRAQHRTRFDVTLLESVLEKVVKLY